MKKEVLYFDLSETYKGNDLKMDEYLLIIQLGDEKFTRKAILLNHPKSRFNRKHLKYYKNMNWN